jgi:PAS domain S-box-containing protein
VDREPQVPQSEAERIFEMSPAFLAVAGFDGFLRRFNPAFEAFGYSREELLSRPWIDFAHPDDREQMQQAVMSLEGGGDVVELENRVVCRDGSLRWVKWSTRVVPEQGLFYAAGRDVTETRRAADEQAALRRVATLVARAAAPDAVFDAVGREVGQVMGVHAAHVGRYDSDATVVSVAQWGRHSAVPIGARFPLDGDSVSARVLRTGRPARMDGYEDAPGHIAATVRGLGIRFSLGVPISVEGRLWGVMIVTSKGPRRFPAEMEARLANFTELAATAVSNASVNGRVRALADEQAALRRVATLVAQDAPAQTLFRVVVEEVGGLLDADVATLGVKLDGPAMSALAMWAADGRHPTAPGSVPIEPGSLAWEMVETGRPARNDDWRANTSAAAALVRDQLGARSSVGAPVMVDDRVWGAIAVHSRTDVLPPETETRLGRFAALVGTAIANAQARAEVARLAEEQAALRRVATLVAEGARPAAVFDAVTGEVAELLKASSVSLARYDDDVLTVVAQRGAPYVRVGERFPTGGTNVTSTVLRTGRTARSDEYADASGPIGDRARRVGTRSVVATPIVLEGRTWGVLAAVWSGEDLAPEDTELRMSQFARLLDTAIANADSRDQLAASRARVLAAADDARRRVVRDLHDGVQQRLVHAVMTLRLAQRALAQGDGRAEQHVAEAREAAERGMRELRELSHGILPSVLTIGGLRAAVDSFVSRLDLLVEVDVASERLPADLEASAYFIVAEALTNVVKHAGATEASVRAVVRDEVLELDVRDDGAGGASLDGHGLVGVADRVHALGGSLRLDSPPGSGTVLSVRLPLST